ncbi:unnamed protein product [Arabidopsis lyrata]|nr:unnamed protein product [Arabidopsis lyrata]
MAEKYMTVGDGTYFRVNFPHSNNTSNNMLSMNSKL